MLKALNYDFAINRIHFYTVDLCVDLNGHRCLNLSNSETTAKKFQFFIKFSSRCVVLLLKHACIHIQLRFYQLIFLCKATCGMNATTHGVWVARKWKSLDSVESIYSWRKAALHWNIENIKIIIENYSNLKSKRFNAFKFCLACVNLLLIFEVIMSTCWQFWSLFIVSWW